MISGSYQSSSTFYAYRKTLTEQIYPFVSNFQVTDACPAQMHHLFAKAIVQMSREGFVAFQLNERLSLLELLEFANLWGKPISEHDADVEQFVEHDYVLNIRAEWDETQDTNRQPFSDSAILLHTEGSRRPVHQQPRYLLFYCVQPPAPAQGGQTLLVPMQEVHCSLSQSTKTVLQELYYSGVGMPPILRKTLDGWIFSFRDFGIEPFQWTAKAPVQFNAVQTAIDEFLHQLYNPALMGSIPWEQEMLVIFDNHHFFHGRTKHTHDRKSAKQRLLQRVRIIMD